MKVLFRRLLFTLAFVLMCVLLGAAAVGIYLGLHWLATNYGAITVVGLLMLVILFMSGWKLSKLFKWCTGKDIPISWER